MIIIELYKYERDLLVSLVHHTHLSALITVFNNASRHPDNNEMIVCKLSVSNAEELVGQLCFEANHSNNKRLIEDVDAIIETIECQIR